MSDHWRFIMQNINRKSLRAGSNPRSSGSGEGFTLMRRFHAAAIVVSVLACYCAPALGADEGGPIQAYRENPWYWEYKGKPLVLIGGSDNDNLFQWTGEKLTEHLDLLVSVGGNYVRNTMSDRDDGDVYAFKRIRERMYDLTKWDDLSYHLYLITALLINFPIMVNHVPEQKLLNPVSISDT